MINYYSETDFNLENSDARSSWITEVVISRNKTLGEVSFIFCSDEYLHDLNVKFLNHDTLTDIISFDESLGDEINGEIYISVERVKENAGSYDVTFDEELDRVMIHGILHFCGLKDKSDEESEAMRKAENEALGLRPNS